MIATTTVPPVVVSGEGRKDKGFLKKKTFNFYSTRIGHTWSGEFIAISWSFCESKPPFCDKCGCVWIDCSLSISHQRGRDSCNANTFVVNRALCAQWISHNTRHFLSCSENWLFLSDAITVCAQGAIVCNVSIWFGQKPFETPCGPKPIKL